MTTKERVHNATYVKVKVSARIYEFHLGVYPELSDSGTAVGYGTSIASARRNMLNTNSFHDWCKACERQIAASRVAIPQPTISGNLIGLV